MLKYFEKVFKVLMNILIFCIVLAVFFAIYNYVELKILNKRYVNFFGYSIFEVASGSMSNYININDVIVVKINSNYMENDVVTYQFNDSFITHRVMKINDDTIITKGDANKSEDAPISKDIVIGKVVKIFKNIGIIKRVILTPKVFISMLLTLLLFWLCFIKKRIRY